MQWDIIQVQSTTQPGELIVHVAEHACLPVNTGEATLLQLAGFPSAHPLAFLNNVVALVSPPAADVTSLTSMTLDYTATIAAAGGPGGAGLGTAFQGLVPLAGRQTWAALTAVTLAYVQLHGT